MKLYILIAAALLFSCGGAHTDTHDHSATEVAHDDHAGHDHSATEAAHDDHAGHDHSDQQAAPALKDAHSELSHEIVLSAAQLKTYNIESEKVVPSTFSSAIRTGGRIISSAGDQSIVAATADGIVTFEARSLGLGREVKRGEVLFTISSQNIQGGEAYARVKATYTTAQKTYQRAVSLAADGFVSKKELEQTELDYKTAKIAYDAQQPSASGTGISIKAPMSGYLTSIDITNGAYTTLGAPLATIAQNKRLAIRADLASRYFDQLPSLTSANFRPSHSSKFYSTTELNGRKTAASQSLAGGSSFLNVDFEVDNRGSLLAGSLLDIYLIGAARADVISVPVGSILEQEGHHYVMVRLDEECFEKREVTLGATNGKRTEILDGLKANENVVTRGAFQVKMANASSAIPDGHNH